jgi:hypothetical protein
MNLPRILQHSLRPVFFAAATLLFWPPLAAQEKQASRAELMEAAILSAHNLERARLSQPYLKWDTKLARDAELYAQKLASNNQFEHAAQSPGNDAQGENLWMGTIGFYGWHDMVGSWLDEKKDLKSGTFPHVSRTANWSDVGHYTQMIWPGTHSVGCGIGRNQNDEYLVCRYYPAGNVIGETITVK